MAKTLAGRFWAKVNKQGPTMPHMRTRCWVWTASTQRGYGQLSSTAGKPPLKAHRVAFYLKHGHWPEPECLHRCDNPPCARWSHLKEGTHAANMREAAKRGRTRKPKSCGRCGAPYSADNTYTYPDGRRACRTCRRRWSAEFRSSAA